MKPLCMLMLGRNGDILNVLPIARHHAVKTGTPTPFIVSFVHAQLLKGASYVLPDSVPYAPHRVDLAVKYAHSKYEKMLCGQVWGRHYVFRASRPPGVPYNVAAWLNCEQTADDFQNRTDFPLVLDRRDAQREAYLITRMVKQSRKPVLLYNLGCAQSSPFASHYVVQSAIETKWSKHCHCINLCHAKGPRLYDLLGLMDMAAVLVSIDTATLHLAAASKVPVIAFINDDPWRGSAVRANAKLVVRYKDALKSVRELHAAIAGALQTTRALTSSLENEQPPVLGASPMASASLIS